MATAVFYSVSEGPVSGLPIYSSATPPTLAQAAVSQEVIAQVSMGITDTQALITHNFSFSPSAAANFFRPQIVGPVWQVGPLGGGTASPFMSFDWTNPNVLKANKLGVAGTEGTFVLYLRRPFSMSR